MTLDTQKKPPTDAGAYTAKPKPARVEMRWARNLKPVHAVVQLTALEQQRAIAALPALLAFENYDDQPAAYEAAAARLIVAHIPEAVRVIELLHKFGFPSIVVKGLPAPGPNVATPANGIVDEAAVKPSVGFLSGLFGAASNLGAFAYATENNGCILRAVAPVANQVGKASSQGFDNDLGLHNDNANQPMVFEPSFARGKPFMNPVQGFIAIKTRTDVPMEVASLDDILCDLEERCGADAISPLFAPDFAVRWPDSHAHGGRIAVEGVPLLVRDSDGQVHSRFHCSNVVGLTDGAEKALEGFREQATTTSVIEISSDPGDLIVYSNTRMMHRRRAFAPRFDGTDRYYVRTYLAPLDILPCSRVIA